MFTLGTAFINIFIAILSIIFSITLMLTGTFRLSFLPLVSIILYRLPTRPIINDLFLIKSCFIQMFPRLLSV